MALNQCGLDFRNLGPSCGSASGIKMAYAALTKGLTAIAINSMVTAKLHNVQNEFLDELKFSQKSLLGHLERGSQACVQKLIDGLARWRRYRKHTRNWISKELIRGCSGYLPPCRDVTTWKGNSRGQKVRHLSENVADVLADFLGK